MEKHMNVPMQPEEAASLRAGDYVYLTGTIYTARDAAHKRMQESLDQGQELPIDIKGQILYYMGPSPARPGRPIGSKLVRLRQAVWINMHQSFWIWDKWA